MEDKKYPPGTEVHVVCESGRNYWCTVTNPPAAASMWDGEMWTKHNRAGTGVSYVLIRRDIVVTCDDRCWPVYGVPHTERLAALYALGDGPPAILPEDSPPVCAPEAPPSAAPGPLRTWIDALAVAAARADALPALDPERAVEAATDALRAVVAGRADAPVALAKALVAALRAGRGK